MEKLSKPTWVKMKEQELKQIIVELAEKHSPSQIGIILRDQYAIPTTKIFGKKLGAFLKELGKNRNEDLENVEKKVARIKEHLKTNVTDKISKHKLQKAQSRFNILRKYSERSKKDN